MTRQGRRICPSTGKIAAVALSGLLLLSFCVLADLLVEGWRDQSYEYIISNVNDFPDYVFLTSSALTNSAMQGWDDASLVNSAGTFSGGYKFDSFIVHAMKTSDFDRDKFFSQRDQYDQETVNCTKYCQDNPRIVSANLTLPKSISVEERIPLKKIEVYLKVDSISDQALNISKTKMLYYYENGTIQELPPEEG